MSTKTETHKQVKGFKSRSLDLKHVPYTVEFDVGTEDANVIDVAMTFRDAMGNPISTQPWVQVIVSSTPNGGPVTTMESAAITSGGDGLEIVDVGTTGIGVYQVGSDGTLDISFTESTTTDYYLGIVDGTGYRFNCSTQLEYS